MKIRPDDSSNWYAVNGDYTLRLNYPELNKNSVVVDIGARHGDWAGPIRERYGCEVICFDVIPEFVSSLTMNGFKSFRYAVTDYTGNINLGIDGDEASIYHSTELFEAPCIDTVRMFDLIESDVIDLLKINIEGAEYAVIDNLIDNSLILKVKNLQVQFHRIENSEDEYNKIIDRLMKTHESTWRYPFVWENWKILNK